jgi:hypothetical protein
MINVCGQQKSFLGLEIRKTEAEIHLLKSEYEEARRLQADIAARCEPASHEAVLVNLNIASIDINIGVDSKYIYNNLAIAQSHLSMLFGYSRDFLGLLKDYLTVEISLRDGVHGTAKEMFEHSFKLNLKLNIDNQLPLYCCEKLGDLSTGMNDVTTTLQWAGILFSLASKYKDKLYMMHAFQHLGQIFSAQGDDETPSVVFDGV